LRRWTDGDDGDDPPDPVTRPSLTVSLRTSVMYRREEFTALA